MSELIEAMRPYAPLLARMVSILQGDENTKIGDALKLAMAEQGIAVIPETVERALTVACFRVITGGFPSEVDA